MFKILAIIFAIFSTLIFANEEAVQTEQMDECEAIYEKCVEQCEQNEETNNEECFIKCEILQDKCRGIEMEPTGSESSSN